jgi:predicted aspartyl protease
VIDSPDFADGKLWQWIDVSISVGGHMLDDMGIFRTTVAVSALSAPDDRRVLSDVMVDTGSEYNWIPATTLRELGIAPVRIDRFETADGRVLEREVGFAMLFAGGRVTPTIVVFARADDLVLLGAIGLEGLNLRVDLGRKELVPAGPVPAAVTMSSSEWMRPDEPNADFHDILRALVDYEVRFLVVGAPTVTCALGLCLTSSVDWSRLMRLRRVGAPRTAAPP